MTPKHFTSFALRALLTALPATTAAAGLAATSCAVFGSSGPSSVGQGKLYRSGDPSFDEFFVKLFEVQRELASPGADQQAALGKLNSQLKLGADSTLDATTQALDARLRALAAGGVRAVTQLPSEEASSASVEVTTAGAAAPSADDQALLTELQQCLRALHELSSRMRQFDLTVVQLQRRAAELAPSVGTTFRASLPRRNEVKKNLADAELLFPILTARAKEAALEARQVLVRLVEVVDALPKDATPAAPAADDGKSSDGATTAPSGKRGSAPPPKAPPAQPTPKKPSGGDFEP